MTIFRCEVFRVLQKRIMLIFPAFLLAACQEADASICKPLSDESLWKGLPKNVVSELRYANRCVRREAYKLGVAEGPPSDVANAAVQACSDAIELYVLKGAEAGLIEHYETDRTLEAERDEFARLARSYVVQTRAGNCQKLPEDRI